MQPVLALELSTDGILLHELSYDGVWRRISAAALNDPYLPKKMVAMKQAARASQGRFFKNQVWLPREHIKGMEVKLTSTEPDERQAEAEALVRADPAFSDGEYIIQFGEEDVNGNVTIAAINKAILQEASRFASGYGFGTQGFTSRDRIDGFYQQPYFTTSPQPKLAINFAKIGFFAGSGAALAAVVAGGYWAITNIDFTPDPSAAIEATEERVLEIDEDPRAPIRPTGIATTGAATTPAQVFTSDIQEPLPDHDATIATFSALVENLPMTSSLEFAEEPGIAATINPAAASAALPPALSTSAADNLPAPETVGFPVVASKAVVFEDTGQVSDFAGGEPITRYYAIAPEQGYVSSPRLTDVLPRDDSTVVLAAQLRKYNDSLGLTQVRDNNAALLQLARTQELQLAPTNVVAGRPTILPVLRGGVKISDVPLPPPLTIAELQALAPVVLEGLPPITPMLRDGRDVTELPTEPEPLADVEETGPDGEPLVQFTTVISGLTTEQLQRIPPRIYQGRPTVLPILRDGVEVGLIPETIDELPDPAFELETTEPDSLEPAIIGPAAEDVLQSEAARLRPLPRPDSVELTALIASVSKQAVPTAFVPMHRADDFTEKADAMAEAAAEQARVTPTFTDAPRQVDVPTSANVARTATIENGINLRQTSLIGVFGTPGDYRALLRQRGGKYLMLGVGDKIDGWTIVAISESQVFLKKGGNSKTLKLPAEG